MMRLTFDCEADGFYESVSRIHCLVIENLDTGEVHKFTPDKVEQGLHMLIEADQIIGHNIIGYDIPVLNKVFPWFQPDWSKVIDTLTLSRLVYGNLSDRDTRRTPEVVAALAKGKLMGRHSLEAWGVRFGHAKVEHEDWTVFTPEMLERCVVDVEITTRLWKLLQREGIPEPAAGLSMHVQRIISRQERYGFTFDEAGANALTLTLLKRKAKLEAELQDTFQPFYLPDGKPKVAKRTMDYKTLKNKAGLRQWGTWEKAEYQPIKLTVFNPGSTHHIVNRLKYLYNWEPTEFTDKGTPKCDDAVLGKLQWPEAKLLAEYFMVIKRLALVSEGDKAFMKHVRGGRCYGGLIVNGTVTGRGTHQIIANIPRVSTPYGKELRALFGPSKGRVQVGIDVSGLELRMLAHFLARWDGGAYGKIVCEGDIHTANQIAAGLATRDQAKTFIYAFLYGGGSEKLGSIFDAYAKPSEQVKIGKKLKADFITKVPGLDNLLKALKEAAKRGYLKGLDGRKVFLRSDHSALNFLLQSGGSLVCLRWMAELDMEIEARGWSNKCQQLIWYHDELQFEVDPDIADEFGKVAIECIGRAQQFFDIRVPLTGEYKIGSNWKECH